MEVYVPNKQHFREILLHNFLRKKSAAKSHRLITELYGDHSPSLKTCEYWFRRFKNNDFDINDKLRSGAPKKIIDTELEALIAEDPRRTQEDLAAILNVSRQRVSQRLEARGLFRREGIWTTEEQPGKDFRNRKRQNTSSKSSAGVTED